ncbi:hypothetical protein Taro_042853 [Colocasia esculenta]|uniref:EF-hand domain-containing protein n=1 Tax=Colocasia esculenta TaxID=4460 RepID=A0A843WPX0_COLES|nr:hypothetical protein [Colocasia esculenta]
MTPGESSTSDHQLVSHSRSTFADAPTISSCTRSASYPPATISTSESTAGSHRASSVLQKLCGFFSPRNPSPSSSAENKHALVEALERPPPRTPTTASDTGPNGAGMTAGSTPTRLSGEEFEKVFRYFDENGDGKISPSELRSCMKAVGKELTAEDTEALVMSTDSDGDGLLEFGDFVKLVDVGGAEERTRDLREAFGMYVMEGQGCITPKSLRRALRRLGQTKTIEECKVMIQQFDLDGDGVLSFDEFKIMML